jgi:MFS family permease
MRQRIDDVLRAFGLVQGVSAFWAAGAGVVLGGLVGGLLAVYSALPWWSVVLISVGAFLLAAGAVTELLRRLRPSPSALTRLIDDGLRLRQRLLDDPTTDPTDAEKSAWEVRLNDWTESIIDRVREIAPHRVGAFQLDLLFSDYLGPDRPQWKRGLLTEIDLTLERLSLLRASL